MSAPKFEFRKVLGRPLRVGGIDYLNSRPLIETFPAVAGNDLVLSHHPPSELASRLRAGTLDVALVPVVEYFLSPCRESYWIVPGVSISSYGPVESIRFYHRRPLAEVERVGLDPASRTSQLLVRLLFLERPDSRWGGGANTNAPVPGFEELSSRRIVDAVEGRQESAGADGKGAVDGALLIGDAALEATPAPGWQALDLGLEWTRWTGLPFVYAFWVLHGDPVPGITECFQEVRHGGYAQIDRIVRRGPLPAGMTREGCLRYLSRIIRFGLGPAELDGLREFAARLSRHGLLDGASAPELRFLGKEPAMAGNPRRPEVMAPGD